MQGLGLIRHVVTLSLALAHASCGDGGNSPCPAGTYRGPGDVECTAFTVCAAGEQEMAAGTTEKDRECACAPGFIETEPGSGCVLHEWIRQFGTDASDQCYGVASAPDRSIVAVGSTEGALAEGAAGDYDVFVRKYDVDGEVLWTRQIGTPEYDEILSVDVGEDSSVVVAGTVSGDLDGPSAGGADVFVRKYDADGEVVWADQFGSDTEDYAYAVDVAADGSVLVGGFTVGSIDGNPNAGPADAFVRKYDADGEVVWTEQFGVAEDDVLMDLAADADGNVYVAGYTHGALGEEGAFGGRDAFVGKLDPDGGLLWMHQVGTADGESATGVTLTSDGGVVIAGTTLGALGGPNLGSYDAFVQKRDADGAPVWTRQFGTPEHDSNSVDVVGASDGAIVLVGDTGGDLGAGSAGGRDAYLRIYEADGELRSMQFGTESVDSARRVAIEGDEALIVCGSTQGALGGENAGNWDAFVMRLAR